MTIQPALPVGEGMPVGLPASTGRQRTRCDLRGRIRPFALALSLLPAAMAGVVPEASAQQSAVPAVEAADGAAQAAVAATVAYDGMLEVADGETALLLKFDGKPDYRLFFMDRPDRLVLEFNNITLGFDPEFASNAGGLIRQLRFGSITNDRSRLVVALSAAAEIRQQALEADAETGRYSLRLSLGEIEQGVFSQRVAEQQALLGASGEAVVKGGRVRGGPKREGYFTIVLDPGHGGIDGGAEGRTTKVAEKDVTLAVSRQLGPMLEKAGPFHIAYTRDDDVFVSLRERQAVARRENADLMVSIHADALRQNYVRGATIYTLADKASDALAQEVADSENLADVVAGLAAPDETDIVTDILADLTLRETTHFSRAFSLMLVRKMRDRVNLINNPQRAASFAVLKNAEVPSVLLELGYLSNNEDEHLMADPDWQSKVAGIVSEAVVEFFAGRQPRSTGN